MKESLNDKEVHCSFCGRSGKEVTSMVAGPDVYICDICIKTSVDILKNNLAAYEKRHAVKGLSTPAQLKKKSGRTHNRSGLCKKSSIGCGLQPL